MVAEVRGCSQRKIHERVKKDYQERESCPF